MKLDNELKKQFKSKFDDYKVSVPEDDWDRVENSLNSAIVAQNLKVRRVWRVVASVAAVAVLILGSLLFLINPIDQDETFISDADQKTLQLKQENSEPIIQSFSSDKVESMNDELFVETCESLGSELITKISECVQSDNYDTVKSGSLRFKQELRKILTDRIKYYNECLGNLNN